MVVIKDMAMPKNCTYCRFRIYDRCYITDKRIDNYNCPQIKDDGCPLVDLAAMLTELQQEIGELKSYESTDGQDLVMLADIGTLFQQKINSLKEVQQDADK